MAQIRYTTKPDAISTSLVGLVFRVIIAWVELEISRSKKVMLGSEKNIPNQLNLTITSLIKVSPRLRLRPHYKMT